MYIKEYLAKIIEKGKKEDMEELSDMLDSSIHKVKECDPEWFEKKKMKLYEMAYGKVLDEDMAKEWVKSMEPVGMHWTMEETNNAMSGMGYNLNKLDFFVVANMMYNDYYNIVKDNEELALKLAKDWLDDVDAEKCKLYNYWKYIIKR